MVSKMKFTVASSWRVKICNSSKRVVYSSNPIFFILVVSRRDEVAGIRAKFPSKVPVSIPTERPLSVTKLRTSDYSRGI